jgi:hypothetical protein
MHKDYLVRRLQETEPAINACVDYLSAHLLVAFSEMKRLVIAPVSTPNTIEFQKKVAGHTSIVTELLDRHGVCIKEVTERVKESAGF